MKKILSLLFCIYFHSSIAGDLYLYDLKLGSTVELTLNHRITEREGYDDQPSFAPDNNTILFSSDRSGNMDSYAYDIASRELTNLTNSTDSNEFSPRTYDGKQLYYVQEQTPQTVWQRPLLGGPAQRVVQLDIPIGYYAADSQGNILFWVRYAFSLYYLDKKGESEWFVTENAGRSLQIIPGTDTYSFVHKQFNQEWWIKRFNPVDKSITPLIGIDKESEDHAWLNDTTLFKGKGSAIMMVNLDDKQWLTIVDLKADGIHHIRRLDVSSDGDRLVFVAED